jgi:LCP family protein required for cell wall assembly
LRRNRPALLTARVLQLIGILLMVVGLAGFLLSRDVERAALSAQQLDLLGIDPERFHASFLVAGRDVLYIAGQSEPVYDENGTLVCWNYLGERPRAGTNTDAIAFVQLRDNELTLVMLPRDLLLDAGGIRLNHVYNLEGAVGLRRRVAEVLGVPIDYHAIIDLDIFERLVDALGGVPVNVPQPMQRTDCAAELSIDLRPGPQVLDGREAAYFVRYRDLPRGDIDRLDNMKLLAYGLLERVKQLDVRGVGRLPAVLETILGEVETNASPALLSRVLPRIAELRLRQAVTIPVEQAVLSRTEGVVAHPAEVESFLAAVFGGTAREFAGRPETRLMITNSSGRAGHGEWYRSRLVRLGVPEDRLALREGVQDAGPTRILATQETWGDADYYAELVHAGKQQIDRLPSWQGVPIGLELVLGPGALPR